MTSNDFSVALKWTQPKAALKKYSRQTMRINSLSSQN